MSNPVPGTQSRQFKAQERYAQQIIDFLWAGADELLVANADGVFYESSIHQLLRRVLPSAQAGEVVNILTESGCISRHGHGVWEIRRKNVFYDDDTGDPIIMGAAHFGHATKAQQTERNFSTLNRRVIELEERVTTLTAIVVGWAQEKGEVVEFDPLEGGEDDVEENDPDTEQRRDVVGDDGA